MGLIDLSTYKPVSGTNADANQVANGFQTIQNLINGGIDNNNFAAGKIFDNTKIMQGGAALGQGLVWNGTSWVPASLAATDLGKTVSGANTDLTVANGNGPTCYATITTGGGTLRSIAAGAYTGQRLIVRNTHSSAVTLKHALAGGTGAQLFLRGAADFALSQYESAEFVYDGTNWAEVSRDTASSAAPGTELGYAEFTATASITGTTDPGTTLVTTGSIALDGSTAIIVEFFCAEVTNNASLQDSIMNLLVDATITGFADFVFATTTASPVYLRRKLTPAAGSHTFAVAARVTSGTTQFIAGTGVGSTRLPGYIRVTRA